MSEEKSLDWHQMLAAAATTSEVLAISQDFVERFTADEWDQLPHACKPRMLATGADLSVHAYDLKRVACEYAGAEQAAMSRLTMFFADAALRLTTLTGPHRSEFVPGIDWERRTTRTLT